MTKDEEFRRFIRFFQYCIDLHKNQAPEKVHLPEKCPACTMVIDYNKILMKEEK